MRLSLHATRDVLSGVQIALAAATVWAAGGGSIWAWLLFLAFSALAYVRRLPEEVSVTTQRTWTFAIFIALVASVLRGLFGGELIDAGVDFLLLMVVQRLFQRQKTREHLQLVLLGAVFMVIGAVINADLNYPILLLLFLPSATLVLLLNLLIGESERLGDRIAFELRRDGPEQLRILWRAALGLAAIAALAGVATFVLFPRFGVGVFLRGSVGNSQSSGFGDTVELGGFGNIKTDTRVVMRMRVDRPAREADQRQPTHLDLYLRGVTLDEYSRGRWTRSREGEQVGMRRLGSWQVFAPLGVPLALQRLGRSSIPELTPIAGFRESEEHLSALVTLEDIGTEAIFIASAPVGVELAPRGAIERRNQLVAGLDRTALVPNKSAGPVQYRFLARNGVPSREELLAVGSPPITRYEGDTQAAAETNNYLQVPGDLGEDFHALTRSLAAGRTSRLERVEAAMQYLEDFRYTTDLRPSQMVVEQGADPVEGFLFELKEGHCEYFATALALMLRDMGVPTRVVNGYHGAHLNEVGGFYTVRQADAHSWVEVDFGPLGWVVFDATPPDGRSAGDSPAWFPAFNEWLDAARNAYLQWIIDYDLRKQLAIAEAVIARGQSGSPTQGLSLGSLALPLLVVVTLIVGTVLWLARGRQPYVHPATRSMLRVLRRLRGIGIEAAPHETAGELASRLKSRDLELAASIESYLSCYEPLRFGSAEPSSAQLQELHRRERAVLMILAQHRGAARPDSSTKRPRDDEPSPPHVHT